MPETVGKQAQISLLLLSIYIFKILSRILRKVSLLENINQDIGCLNLIQIIYISYRFGFIYLQKKSEGQHLIHVNMYNLGFVIHRTSSLNKNLSNSNHSIDF